MVQILIQLDEQTAKELETVAPAESRKRSRFIRLAIRAALMQVQDVETRAKYTTAPDDERAYFNPGVWDEWAPQRKKRKARTQR